jgi:hypothetical protein
LPVVRTLSSRHQRGGGSQGMVHARCPTTLSEFFRGKVSVCCAMSKIINWAVVQDRRRRLRGGFFFEVRTSFFRGAITLRFGCRVDTVRFGRRGLFCFARLAFLAIFILLPSLIFWIFRYWYCFASFPFKF